MRGLIQRVNRASVSVAGETVGSIDTGILLLLGIAAADSEAQAGRMLDKLLGYRIFPDQDGRMNLNVQDAAGGVLVVSQFTLVADTAKGLRPGFSSAADPARAENLYAYFVEQLRQRHHRVATGVFAANMQVSLENDGPVTFILDVN